MLSRAEAFPLHWDQLTDDQKNAVRNIAGLFGELSERAWEPPRKRGAFDRFLVRLDDERRNHVALIQGARGMGKTAVLLSLMAAWGELERAEQGVASRFGFPEGVLRGRIVPVGLVDLQPLPPGANLLVHLAGQLSRLVDAIDDDGARSPGRHDAWNPNKSAEAASRRQWRTFVQAAASGWAGRLDARRAGLDPEAFALEFEEAERHRLDVPEQFRELADALVDEYRAVFTQRRGTPFFVIPVDDADMNPTCVRELLDLIRTLWHPRVGFLLTGHGELFVEVLKEHLAGGRERPTSSSDKLAEAIYQKAIPPYQRFELPALPIIARRQLLAETLAKAPVFDHPLKPANLLDYLEVNRLAAIILPDNMRQLRDWEVRLVRNGLEVELHERDYVRFMRRGGGSAFCVRLAGNDVGDMEVAGDAGPPDDEYDGLMHISLMQAMLGDDAHGGSSSPRPRTTLGRTVRDNIHFDWPIPHWRTWLDYAAFAYLLRNVFEVQVSESIERLEAEYRWYYARSNKSFTRDVAVRTFLTWTIRYIEFRRDRSRRPSGSLHEALSLLLERETTEVLKWHDLAASLDALADDAELAAEEQRWAAMNVALFAAPEHRLPHEIANSLLQRVKDRSGAEWKDITMALREQRSSLASKKKARYDSREEKNTPEPGAMLAQIDAQSSRYLWVTEISRIEAPHDELLVRLSEFASLPLAGEDVALAWYIDPDRWSVLQQTVSDDLRGRWLDRLGRLPRGGISAPLAVMVMWNEAIRAGATPGLDPLDQVPTRAVLQGRYELVGLDPWGFQDEGTPLDVGDLRLKPARLAWRSETGLQGTLDGVLFEMLWDVVTAAEDRETSEGGTLDWWAPAGKRGDDAGVTIPWPCPAWPAFSDHRIFAASFNEQLRRIRQALPALPPKYDLASGVADYYVRATIALQQHRRIRIEWEASPSGAGWQYLFSLKGYKPTGGARALAYRSWINRIPLLAAPESGLSPDTAKAILDAYAPTPDEKQVLREARRARLRHLGLADDARITAELARIDAEHEGHPWLQQLGTVT